VALDARGGTIAPTRAFDVRAGIIAPARAVPLAAALVLAVLGFVPLANMLTEKRYAPWFTLVLAYWIVVGGALLILLVLAARWKPQWLERAETAIGRRAMRVPPAVFVGIVAAFATIAAATIAIVCFGRQPQDVDEAATLWQAKILTSGRLWLPADPNPEFFAMDDTIFLGRWYAQYPVGAPALLALGIVTRLAWLLNPVLVGLTVVSVHAFARRAYGERVARLAALLTAFAPFVLFMGASYMSYVPLVLLATVAMTQLVVWHDASSPRALVKSAALIGVSLGVAFLVRPLDALVLSIVIGVMQLLRLKQAGERARLKSMGWQLVAGGLLVAIQLWVNARTTGSPVVFGYDVLYGAANRLGFHLDPYGAMHTPARGLSYASKYMLQLNSVLFEWPLPALGLVVAGLFALRRPSRWDYFLLALIGAQLITYSLFWSEGMFRGPRYIFTIVPAVIILVARAPFLAAQSTSGILRRVAPLVIPACLLFTWLPVWSNASIAGRVRRYRRLAAATRVDPVSLARQQGLQHALVFVNQDSKNRALHRLWALGLSQGDALRLLGSAPVCAVRLAIDAEEAMAPRRVEGRLERLVQHATRIDPNAPLPAACADDARRDAAGWTSFTPFFPANQIGPDGRLNGDVVYALDLGEHNEVLRGRFGDRMWYRFDARSGRAVRYVR
jgi:hypothetical protein